MFPKTGIAILFAFCLGMPQAQAAPVGSPASLLKKGQWDFAIEGGYIYRRPITTNKDNSDDYEVSMWNGWHSRSYGLTDRISIKGKIGGAYGYIYDNLPNTTAPKTSLSGGLLLGLQTKGILYQDKASGIEWDGSGQFLYICSHHKRSGKANADWYEWQMATCLAKKLGIFKPYAGVQFSTLTLDHDDGQGNKTSYEEGKGIGPFLGTDIFFGKEEDIVLNLELSGVAATEFYGGIHYRF